MSARQAPPTEAEVLGALEQETIYKGQDGPQWKVAGRLDVADRIARNRGWDGIEGLGFPGRPQMIGKYVSVGAVQKVLEKLDAETKVYAFYGRHKFIAVGYGVNPNGLYYLSQPALDRLLAERRKRWQKDVEKAALATAQERVLAEHPADVDKYRQENLAGLLAAEPDWQAMLNEDQEAEAGA